MFEYGKDIPLEGTVAGTMNQQGSTEVKPSVEGSTFTFDHRMDIPLDGVNGQ